MKPLANIKTFAHLFPFTNQKWNFCSESSILVYVSLHTYASHLYTFSADKYSAKSVVGNASKKCG